MAAAQGIRASEANSEVTKLRIAVLWVLLAVAAGVFVAMLGALRHHWAHVTTSAHPNAGAEYVWTVIPWLILALCLAPAVHRVLAAEENTTCVCCLLVDGMTQPRIIRQP